MFVSPSTASTALVASPMSPPEVNTSQEAIPMRVMSEMNHELPILNPLLYSSTTKQNTCTQTEIKKTSILGQLVGARRQDRYFDKLILNNVYKEQRT